VKEQVLFKGLGTLGGNYLCWVWKEMVGMTCLYALRLNLSVNERTARSKMDGGVACLLLV